MLYYGILEFIFFLIFIYLFCLHWLFVAAGRLLSCGMHVGSSSLTRDRTWAPCIGRVESYPLCHQGSPWNPRISELDIRNHFACLFHFKDKVTKSWRKLVISNFINLQCLLVEESFLSNEHFVICLWTVLNLIVQLSVFLVTHGGGKSCESRGCNPDTSPPGGIYLNYR